MKRRKNLIVSAITCMFSICLMMFGVYAATNPSVSISGQVSYSARDAKVLVLGKVNGQAGNDSNVDYPAVADLQNPTESAVSLPAQYLGYTKGESVNDSTDDLPKWNMGTTAHAFYEDSTGIRPITISFMLRNLSNYPVVATVDFTGVTDANLAGKNLTRETTGLKESKVYLDKNISKEITIKYAVIDDSVGVNSDKSNKNLLDMSITFEKTVFPTPVQSEVQIGEGENVQTVNQSDWKYTFDGDSFTLAKFVGKFQKKDSDGNSTLEIPSQVKCEDGTVYPIKTIGTMTDYDFAKVMESGNEEMLFSYLSIVDASKLIGKDGNVNEEYFNTIPSNIVIPEGIEKINSAALVYATGIKSLPESVKEIGGYGCAGISITTLNLPNVEKIGQMAFVACSSLTTINLPNLAWIGDSAFEGCENLTTMIIQEEDVSKIYCGKSIFGTLSSSSNLKIYIPVEDYKTATNWSEYADRMVVGKYIAVVSEQTIDHWKIQTYTDDTTAIIKYVGDLPEKDENGKINIVIPSSLVDKDGKTYQITSIGTRYEVFDIAGSGMELYDLLQYLSIFSDFDINHDDKDESYVYVNGTINITISEGIKSFNLMPFGSLVLGTVSIPSTINISDISSDMSTETILLSSFPFMSANIKEVKFASGIKKIPSVFSWISEIDTVVIPASVEIIDAGAFESTGINNLSIESGSKLKTIGDSAFSAADGGYSTITNFVMPDTVETIGERAFYHREGLKTITLSKNLKTIGAGAFEECKALSSIDIPSGVQSIGNEAFRGCSALTSIDIQSGVQSIGEFAFASCNALESIVVPKSVTCVGDHVFNECTSLKKVNLSPRVIYSDMFYSCPLEEVVLGEGVVEIKRLAFQDIQSITSISLPSSLQIVGDYAFSGCDGLKSESNLHGNAYYLGNETNPYVLLLSGKDSTITSCEINQMTKVIYSQAFYEFSSLESLTFAENSQLISIGSMAFSGCSALTSSLDIPNGVTTIGSYAFSGCSSLTSVTIPNSVTDIDTGVFSRCSGLKCNLYDNAYYLGNETNPYLLLLSGKDTSITSCTINQKTKFIHSDAFRFYYKSLTSVKFAENGQLISIGESAFQDCKALTNISIPKSVKILRYYVFGGCPLKSVEIPDSVTSMSRAFYGCGDELTTVTIHAETPPAVDDNTIFGGCSNLVAIYVPAASVDAYKNADGWKFYADKIQAIS